MMGLSYTLTVVLLGTLILGATAGAVGTFIVLRRQALVGDALSHATLPGVVGAFMLMQIRRVEIFLIGAFVVAFLAMALLEIIKRYSRIKFDASMALILSSFFGFGQVLLSHVQKTGASSQAGLSRFIFGQAATLLRSDVYMLAGVAAFLVIVMLLFWKELKLYIFDESYFKALGYSERVISAVLTLMVVLTIVIGIWMVGVILMSALLIAPAVAARQFSNRFYINVAFAAFIGGVSGMAGTYLSADTTNMPTGPVIAIVLGVVVLFSVLFAPRSGIVKRGFQNLVFKSRIKKYRKLIHFHETPSASEEAPEDYAYFLERKVMREQDGHLELTDKGLSVIRKIKGGRKP